MPITQNRSRVAQGNESEGSMIQSAYAASEDCVRDNPVTSAFLAAGAGAVIGLLLAYAVSRREEEERRSYLSQLGSKIYSSVGNVIPESLHRR